MSGLVEFVASFWAWLSDNYAEVGQLLATFVTAIATIALWRVTKVLAVETTTLAAMTSQPFVTCGLESSGASPNALNVTLRNTGNAAAFDITVEVSPAMPEKPDGRPSDAESVSTYNCSLLPPGQTLPVVGVLGQQVYDTVFSASVYWSRRPGDLKREGISYSFRATDGFRGGWRTKTTHDLVEETEKLRNEIAKFRA